MAGPTVAFQTGIHSARPAADAGCVLYSCTTHGLVYRSDGTSWTTWATLGGTLDFGEDADIATIGTANAAGATGEVADAGHVHNIGTHASRHQSGGADAIKIDDLAAGDDNTDLNVSTSKHGLAPKLDNNAAHYLDGTGAWSTPGGGGGGGVDAAIDCKGWVAQTYTSTNALAITIPAQASGTRILLAVGTRSNDVTSVTCTNVTWTEVKGWNSSTNTYLSIYVGVVSGGSSGTTITVNVGGTNYVFGTAVFLGEALTPTTGNDASFTGTASTNRRLPLTIATTPGDIVVMAYTTSDASSPISAMELSSPFFIIPDQAQDGLCGLHLVVGKAGNDHVSGWYDGGNGTAIVVGLVGIS